MSGNLFVISGPSGVGKSSVIRRVRDKYPNIRFSVSATTRKPRPSEKDGVDYYFVTKEKFERMLAEDAFLEHARYVDNYYGTPEGPIQEALEAGIDIILDIEPQGAFQVKAKRPHVPLIFVLPPTIDTLRQRLMNRGDTSPEAIEHRLERARWEIAQSVNYDYLIVNEDREQAARDMLAVFEAVKHSACNQKEIVNALLKEE